MWAIRDSGENERQVALEQEDANAPSVCGDGRTVFYDVGGEGDGQDFGGDIHVKVLPATEGTTVLNCRGHLDANGEPDPWLCFDVDCGPPAPGSNNPRIVFRVHGAPGMHDDNLYMAEWNGQTLSEPVALTNTPQFGIPPDGNNNLQPAWCGAGVVAFVRYVDDGGHGEYTICTLSVDFFPVGGIQCHDTNDPDSVDGGDEFDEEHPSCGQFDGVWKIAYAKQKSINGNPLTTYKICTVDRDFAEDSEVCTPFDPMLQSGVDQTLPTWAPGGTQIAFSMNLDVAGGDDYDIYVINYQDLSSGDPVPLGADDTVDDLDPDWGPAVLGP